VSLSVVQKTRGVLGDKSGLAVPEGSIGETPEWMIIVVSGFVTCEPASHAPGGGGNGGGALRTRAC
jgi:hypothetical protein